MITTLLVDDKPAVRFGIAMRLALEPDIHVIGQAGDGLAALEMAPALNPQVIVLDVEMPKMDGITTARLLRTIAPNSSVVILSGHDDLRTRTYALEAGAVGFVAKHEAADALPEAIRLAVSYQLSAVSS